MITKRELMVILEQLPDEVEIGLVIPIEDTWEEPAYMETTRVEEAGSGNSKYCLIYGGEYSENQQLYKEIKEGNIL